MELCSWGYCPCPGARVTPGRIVKTTSGDGRQGLGPPFSTPWLGNENFSFSRGKVPWLPPKNGVKEAPTFVLTYSFRCLRSLLSAYCKLGILWTQVRYTHSPASFCAVRIFPSIATCFLIAFLLCLIFWEG